MNESCTVQTSITNASMSDVGKTSSVGGGVKREALATLASGDLAMSAGALRHAARLHPEDPEIAFHLGTVMLHLERPEAAAFHLERALAQAPGVTAIHCNLANALLRMEDVESAIAVAEQGLAKAPDDPALNNMLGNALVVVDRRAEAAERYSRAWRAEPRMLAAAVNLANVQRDLGEREAARKLYDTVLERAPAHVEAHVGLAMVARDGGDIEAAIAAYRRALGHAPGHPRAMNNLGILLMERGDWHDAHELFRDGATLWRENAEVHGNLAQCLQALGRHDEAVVAFDEALALDPEVRRLRPFLLQSLLHQCDWDRLESLEARVLADAEARLASNGACECPPFVLAATRATPALRLGVAQGYARRLARLAGDGAMPAPLVHERPTPRRLRVGFISPDFRRHSLAMSFAGPLGAFDRRDFAWFGYSIARDDEDEWTVRFRRDFHRFRRLTDLSPGEAARRIHDDRIDVLVDLAGHTRHSALEILAFRPAPVQVHYLGQGATLGAEWIDYLVTDHAHTPKALEPHVAEALVRLPTSFMATERPTTGPPISRAEAGLPDDAVVMANFNAHSKFHPELFHVWMRLLRRLPGSVLWLGEGSERAQGNLMAEAARHLVDPRRLIFARHRHRDAHLARLALADLALDTAPHAGGVTTLDALWAGLPVVTLAGPAQSSRTGVSILAAMGLEELIAEDARGYEEIVHRLACVPAYRERVRARVREACETTPSFDPPILARHLEWAFREMARRYEEGRAPENFDVPRLDVANALPSAS